MSEAKKMSNLRLNAVTYLATHIKKASISISIYNLYKKTDFIDN